MDFIERENNPAILGTVDDARFDQCLNIAVDRLDVVVHSAAAGRRAVGLCLGKTVAQVGWGIE